MSMMSAAVSGLTFAVTAQLIPQDVRPFQSLIHSRRSYRELRLLKHMKHENVREDFLKVVKGKKKRKHESKIKRVRPCLRCTSLEPNRFRSEDFFELFISYLTVIIFLSVGDSPCVLARDTLGPRSMSG